MSGGIELLEDRELLGVERAAAFLAECRNVDEVRDVRDKARAIEVYQRTRGASLEAQQDASEIALRAERRLGELCHGLTGGRGGDRTSEAARLAPTLEDLGISKSQSSRWQQLAAVEAEAFEEHVRAVRDRGERLTTAGTIRAVSSAEGYDGDEWYTPSEYLEAAREVLGGIDLDPASSEAADIRVKAGRYFDRDDDGLSQVWLGRVWLNPPFSKGGAFAAKLLEELAAGRTTAAIVLQNAATDVRWFHDLAAEGWICLLRGRISFHAPDGSVVTGNRSPQVIFYLGPDGEAFCRRFAHFGLVGRLEASHR